MRLAGALRAAPPVACSPEGPRRRTTTSLPSFQPVGRPRALPGRRRAVLGWRPPAGRVVRGPPRMGALRTSPPQWTLSRVGTHGPAGPRPSGLARMGPPRARTRLERAPRRMASPPLLPSRSSAATSSAPRLAPMGTRTSPTRCPWTPTPTAGWEDLRRRLLPQTAGRTRRALVPGCPRLDSRAPAVDYTVLRHGGPGLVPGVAARIDRPLAGGAGGLLAR